MTSPYDEPLGYQEIADELRGQITSGVREPGATMPSERTLAQEYGVSALTANRAMQVLRREGIVVGRRGFSARVRMPDERALMKVQRGSSWYVRMPTSDEKRERGIPEGVAVVVMTLPSGVVQIIRSDQVEFENR